MSIKAIHTWRLKQADGKTNVRTAESFEGLLARLLRRRLRRTARPGDVHRWFDRLKGGSDRAGIRLPAKDGAFPGAALEHDGLDLRVPVRPARDVDESLPDAFRWSFDHDFGLGYDGRAAVDVH